MIYLTDQCPNFCPQCGHHRRNGAQWGKALTDFYAGASFKCPHCGAMSQYLNRGQLIAATRSHGDLALYADD